MKRLVVLFIVLAMILAITIGSAAAFEVMDPVFSITKEETTTYYGTLKDAMDAAVDGDTILVHMDAEIAEQATADDSRSITLKAAEGVDPVLTRAAGFTESMIVVEAGADLTIEGITLDGGAGSDSFAPNLAGARESELFNYYVIPVVGNEGLADCDPIIATSGNLEIVDSVLQNNYMEGTVSINKNGSAIHVAGGNTTVTGTTFQHNLGCWGSAIYACGAESLSLEDCTIENNFAVNVGNCEGYHSGGTIYAEDTATITVENCDFTNNTVSIGNGGGIYVKNTDQENVASMTVNNSNFIGNTVGNDGFAIQVNENVTTSVTNCNMKNNTGITDPGGQSVATISYMSVVNYCLQEITNCVFEGNVGPISCIGNHGCAAVIEVEDSTFTNNIGTLSQFKSATTSFTNCTFTENTGAIFSCASLDVASDTVRVPELTVTNCTITGNSGSNVVATWLSEGSDKTPFTIKIEDSEIKNNTSSGNGTIYNHLGADITIKDSTIQDNTVNGSFGGAVYSYNATLKVEGSTLKGNSTQSSGNHFGGALYLYAGEATVKNSTIEDNSSMFAGGVVARQGATLELENTTITGNTATAYGGGLMVLGESTATADANTKIYDNFGATGADDIFLQSSGEKNPSLTIYEVGEQEVTVTCGEESHPIDGWYTDNIGARWNTHDSEKAYCVNRQTGSAPFTFTGTYGGSTNFALKAAHSYLINYELNGGTNHEDNPSSYLNPESAIALKDPEKDGNIFGGWYTNASFTEESKITEIPEDSTGDVTVYAQWLEDSNGDNIPDIYQKEVTLKIENGTWADGTTTAQTIWVTLTDENGNLSETGTGELTLPTGMKPGIGYEGGAWTPAPGTTATGNEPVTYTYSFTEIPVPDGEVRYFVYHYKPNEDGTYPEEPTDIDLKSGKPGEQATGTPKTYEGFCLNTKDSILTGELTDIDSIEDSVILKFYYDKDSVGEDGSEPDNIPDKYQKEVTLKIENGTWADGTTGTKTVWVTLEDGEGNWSETGTGELTLPTGMKPGIGYEGGAWSPTPGSTVTGTDSVTYTYSFTEIPVPDGEVRYFVYHYKPNEDGTYPEEPTDIDLKSGKPGEQATGTPKTYEGFCLNTKDSILTGELTDIDSIEDSVILKFYYDKDSVGEDGSEPDNIPDKYQKEVTLKVENGTWADGTTGTKTVWVTLEDGDGNWSETGTGELTLPTGMKPGIGYEGGAWSPTPGSTVTGTDSVTYTYTFKKVNVKVTYEKYTDGKTEEVTEELPNGTVVTLDSNGGEYDGSKEPVKVTLTEDTKLKTPTCAGYTFNGWKVTEDAATGSKTFTAQWTKIPTTTATTGDDTNLFMMTSLFILSAAAIALICAPRKPKGKYLRR